MYRLNDYIVVGNGLIANEFISNADSKLAMCLYAAGVSNSRCKDLAEFKRDKDRLIGTLAALPDNLPLFYVSPPPPPPPPPPLSPYIEHKMHMEALVLKRPSSRVIRLPQVAGASQNPHTLLNYFFNQIKNKKPIDIWLKSTRNIIDVRDARKIVIDIFENVNINAIPNVINIANPKSIGVQELVSIFESELDISVKHRFFEGGDLIDVDMSWIQPSIERCQIDFESDYIRKIIKYYYANE